MKLKNLLFENSEDIKKARKLQSFFDGGEFLISNENLIYRGIEYDIEEDKIDYFEVRPIRKDRKPKNTPDLIQDLVDYISILKYPDIPERSKSKFGSTNRKEADMYGDIYVVFPEKDASIISFEKDAFNILPNSRKLFRASIDFIETPVENFAPTDLIFAFDSSLNTTTYIKQLFVGLVYFYRTGNLNEQLREVFTNNSISQIINQLKRFKKEVDERRKGNIDLILREFKDINNYFEKELKKGIKSSVNEIMFNGDKYLIINEDFFQDYFVYSNGKWQIKDELNDQV